MKLFKKFFRTLSLPLRKLSDAFFSTELIYLVVPFDEQKILDLNKIVIYHDYEDAERGMEYLKQFYPYVVISVETLNFKYIDSDE
jgi:hypothetical protein